MSLYWVESLRRHFRTSTSEDAMQVALPDSTTIRVHADCSASDRPRDGRDQEEPAPDGGPLGDAIRVPYLRAACDKSIAYLDAAHRQLCASLRLRDDAGAEDARPLLTHLRHRSRRGRRQNHHPLPHRRRHRDLKILYLTFNKALVNSFDRQKAPNVTPQTFDSLVYRTYRQNNPDIEIQDLRYSTMVELYPWMRKIPKSACMGVLKQFERFCTQTKTNSVKEWRAQSKALETLWVDTLTSSSSPFAACASSRTSRARSCNASNKTTTPS